MSPVVGPFFAATLLVGAAGVMKLVRPDTTRVALRSAGLPGTLVVARSLGAVEVVLALATLWWGGPLLAGGVALAYLGFAGFSALLLQRTKGRASCGCFGDTDAPVTRLHVGVNVALAAVAVAAALGEADGFGPTVADQPGVGDQLAFVLLVVVLVRLVVALLTDLPALQAAQRRSGPAARRAA
jgi:hypothetical protein